MPKKKAEGREIDALVQRLILVLESQRRLGGDAYPPTLERLGKLCELLPTDERLKTAASKSSFTARAVVARKRNRTPLLNSPVILKESIEDEDEATSIACALLVDLVRDHRTRSNVAFSIVDLKKKLPEALRKAFQKGVERGMEWQSLPPEVAWVWVNRSPRLFLREDLRPSGSDRVASEPRIEDRTAQASDLGTTREAVTVERDFATAFREAFDRIDRQNGATNFVKLAELRRSLPEFDRFQFDEGLNRLRDQGVFSLDSHEGNYGQLTSEEREAGLREAGSLLVYVSRR